jgi:plasmid stability protein
MLEFLLVFHSDAIRASATAILKAGMEDEAMRKACAIALHDGRSVELWRNQRMIARFPGQDDDRG